MSETVRYEVDDAVATITLNRPEAMNTMGEDLLPRALAHLSQAASDDAIRAVILTGTGRAFCAGGDLNAISGGGIGDRGGVSRRSPSPGSRRTSTTPTACPSARRSTGRPGATSGRA